VSLLAALVALFRPRVRLPWLGWRRVVRAAPLRYSWRLHLPRGHGLRTHIDLSCLSARSGRGPVQQLLMFRRQIAADAFGLATLHRWLLVP
jgi:hypothetical protein